MSIDTVNFLGVLSLGFICGIVWSQIVEAIFPRK
jgi:hypothetical protein